MTCNINVAGGQAKKVYKNCAKKAANNFIKKLSPDPLFRFEEVTELILHNAVTEVHLLGIGPLIAFGPGGGYWAANYFSEFPIPDYFRQRNLRSMSSRRLGAIAPEEGKDDYGIAPDADYDPEGFRTEFRKKIRNGLLACLKKKGFFHEPPQKRDVECNGSIKKRHFL
eukprot:CAMPEP_0118675564 /NCGR_PEP_ID=MMETSP0800-20121206/1530_1 /TAXON_ID=210618 ORGANISM="Striatella unipunctata, Strain CCMP2910" /NCGR_SAMPLE_ID=MMETSP0800 /ASSEMBLY_ACC=CAM_ASM_000638 /LENGTH=167 /DNA_ID=CAMNT_0006570917 /DNA_START=29 /DNA_END=532 /DNA_ORIENTATION=-